MKVLLAGGAGYIGSHTAVELCSAGHDIVVVDSLVNSSRKAVKAIEKIVGKTVRFYEVDCQNYKALKSVFKKEQPDAVMHFAGLKSVNESIKMPREYWDNNINSTLTLLRVMDETACKSLIFSSSATVYGTPKTLPISEDAPVGIGIANPYGETKYTIERILMHTRDADPSWSITILRYFNPVGAHSSGLIGEDPNGIPNNLMPYVAQVAIGKLPHLDIYGNDYDTHDGTGVRDYIHVVDLARGHVRALKKLSPSLKIYNLGTGTGVSVLDLVHAYEIAATKDLRYKFTARRPGDVAAAYADPQKANRELRWRTKYSVEDACLSSHKWQSMNPDGFVTRRKGNIYSIYLKRTLDVIVATVALVALSPLFVLVSIAIHVDSSGPIIFSQKRVGKNRKAFHIYKFRTMTKDTPPDISAAKRKSSENTDARLTRVGRILRITSIDELPQLYNILKGDMSLIGPRPVIPRERKLTDERERLGVLTVRPGITGLAQVKGRNDIDYLQKAEFDAQYVGNMSLRQDLAIIVRSVYVVLTRSGNQDVEYRPNHRIGTHARYDNEK